jgi:ankyrin repeat protein
MFLKAGIEYKGRNQFNETILFVSACGNNSTLTEILIEGGCDLNECTRSWTALHVAAARNHDEVLRVLVKHGCDLNIRDRDGIYDVFLSLRLFTLSSLHSVGFNALMLAILNENFKNIKLLVQCGCSINLEELYSTPCLAKQLAKYPAIERILWNERTRAKNLKELCRLRIRASLGQRTWRKAGHLQLPNRLRDYVALKEIFATCEDQQPPQASLTRLSRANPEELQSS